MKVEDIKNLPKEFDFKSKVNSLTTGMLYHAKEEENGYKVTWNLEDRVASCTYSKKKFRKFLLNDEFLIVANKICI